MLDKPTNGLLVWQLKNPGDSEQREIKIFESVCGGTVEGPTGLYDCADMSFKYNYWLYSTPVPIIVVIGDTIRLLSPYIMRATAMLSPMNPMKELICLILNSLSKLTLFVC